MNKLNCSYKPKIWVDLDETLCYTVNELLNKFPITIDWILAREEHITDYYLYKIPWISIKEEEAIELFREIMYKDFDKHEINPIFWAKEKLETWKKSWFELDIVTARDSHLFWEYTNKWLEKHFPGIFSQIHFANHFWIHGKWIPKSELCRQNWISVMIEDNHDYAMETARAGIKTFLLSKPWNFHKKEKHENLIKVEHWWKIEID